MDSVECQAMQNQLPGIGSFGLVGVTWPGTCPVAYFFFYSFEELLYFFRARPVLTTITEGHS